MSDELDPAFAELVSEGETGRRDIMTRTRSDAVADGDLIVAPYPLRTPVFGFTPPGIVEPPIGPAP